MVGHPEGKEVSAFLAPETVEHLLGPADRERGRFFRVEGAQPHIALAGPLELNKLTDQLNDVHGPLDLFFGSLVKVHGFILSLTSKSLCPEKEKTPSLDEGVVQRSVFV
jgi:hypothetical protein